MTPNDLNADIGCPFYNRITQQGIPSTNKTCLTIPALKDAMRRSGLLGRTLHNNKAYELGPLCGSNDLETLEKGRAAFTAFFSLIRESNLSHWEIGREGFLCTNVAVQAYTMLLGSLIKYWEANVATPATEISAEEIMSETEHYVEPIVEFIRDATPAQMEAEFKVPFGSGGPREYYFRLCRLIKRKVADFEPEGMEGWEKEQSEENVSEADRKLKDIGILTQQHLFQKLKSMHGDSPDDYIHKGIPNKKIIAESFARSLENDERLPLENYLNFIDYKVVIEHKQNWDAMRPIFDIPEPGEKGHAKNVKWMDRINELRRIPAHPSRDRTYKLEDLEYIDYIYAQLKMRVENASEPAAEDTENA